MPKPTSLFILALLVCGALAEVGDLGVNAGGRLHPKARCLLDKLYAELDLPEDIRLNLQRRLNERDFSLRVELTDANVYEALGAIDFKLQYNLAELLVNYRDLPEFLQRNVHLCQLSVAGILDRCHAAFPDDKCEMVDDLVVAKACPDKYESVGYSHCVPACPSGYDDVDSDPFVCDKAHASARAGELQARFQIERTSYRGLADAYQCPDNFSLLLNDICVRNCPFGWEDLGVMCLKPNVVRRDYEIFFYDFDSDQVPMLA